MKILLANKFYYPRGGDCIYTLNLESLLKEHGHEVAVFAIQHPENKETPFRRYFPTEVSYTSVSDERNRWKAITRPLGTREVRQKFTELLDDFRPDVVHLNNIHTHLSPVLAVIAYRKGIRVVWTLHDFKLLCPRYDCLRNDIPCELCFRNKSAVLKFNCVKNNLAVSLLAYVEALKWNRGELERYTHVFICPSRFMKNKMLAAGFNASKLKVLPNFTSVSDDLSRSNSVRENYYAYIGRLSKEKGVETLLAAAQQAGYPLRIAGDGPLLESLKTKYESDTIHFLGRCSQKAVAELMSRARFTVIPSIWYENNPLAVIESLCLGTPVLGSNIGGIPELINPGKTGMICEPGNAADWTGKIREMFHLSQTFDYQGIQEQATKTFSAKHYYSEIISVYKNPGAVMDF
ncbi:MAG: glycosyltransferase family 4 protein [Dysgonamonadaceae bacterium]|nr:glycosyltransferase family 4 protein [Dysgonamonadaceae bacterium]